MPFVSVFGFQPVSGNFYFFQLLVRTAGLDGNSQKLIFIKAFLENLFNFFGFGVGCHIPILGLLASQSIPNTAADNIGLKAFFLEFLQNGFYFFRDGHFHLDITTKT